MKAKTKLQRDVIQCSQHLINRRNELLPWAAKECLEHKGYTTKSRVICMDCGQKFSPELVSRKRAICPHCNTKLTIEQSRKRTDKQRIYFAIAEIYGEYQVIRNFELRAYYNVDKPVYHSCYEVLQHWITPKGKREVVARNHTLNWVCDSWNGDMEIRKHYPKHYDSGDRYDIYPYKYHPNSVFKEEYRRYGIDQKLQGLTFIEAIRILPTYPKAETLLKSKQYSLFGHTDMQSKYNINKYWPSIKICLRNNYKVYDAKIWFDYLDLLQYFKKDLHNAKFVCPKNLKKEHDHWMKKKRKVMDMENLKKNYIELRKKIGEQIDKKTFVFPKNLKAAYKELSDKWKKEEMLIKQKQREETEAKYREFIQQFIDLEFRDGELQVIPLKSVEEFMQEGDELNHCVFTNDYYKRHNSLILSARLAGKRLETIEIGLNKLDIIQCRGRSNMNTEYHDRIIQLVKKNKSQIRKRMDRKKMTA